MRIIVFGKRLWLFATVLFFPVFAFCQSESFFEKFQEANRLDEEAELNQAFHIWTSLASQAPENANVNYKAGIAYLNTGSNKGAALPFLERAAKGKIDNNYDPFSPFEKNVPVEVYYYYAKALHLNYKLDKAEEYYEKFMMQSPGKHFLYPKATRGTEEIAHARSLMKNPVEFEIENLGPVINTQYPDYAPVISVDENALFFTSARLRKDESNEDITDRATGYYLDDIYVSYKDREGNWQEPELLSISDLNPNATINVSIDGQKLYIYRDDEKDGNLFKSVLVGETWSEPEPMPDEINSKAWETHLATTSDENTIYFVSNRKGTLGGRDIFRVKKLPDGSWSKAQNLGENINTPYGEDAVFISPDNRTLYFSSEGHNSMGGFDIFYSTLDEEGNWSKAQNIGYPINTVDDDVFFVTSADGKRAYYSSDKKEGYGEKDIYMISLPDPVAVQLAVLQGRIIAPEGRDLPEDIVIYITSPDNNESQIFSPRERDGGFVAILPPCESYEIDYTIDGKSIAVDTFKIDCKASYQELTKQLILSGDDADPVLASSLTGDNQPANFQKFFGYNQRMVSEEEEMYDNFLDALKNIIDFYGTAKISIVGSASKVPTKTYSSNQELADLRAENAREQLIEKVKKAGIDIAKLNFVSVEGKVQGPEYGGDANEGIDKYKKYQYIQITVK